MCTCGNICNCICLALYLYIHVYVSVFVSLNESLSLNLTLPMIPSVDWVSLPQSYPAYISFSWLRLSPSILPCLYVLQLTDSLSLNLTLPIISSGVERNMKAGYSKTNGKTAFSFNEGAGFCWGFGLLVFKIMQIIVILVKSRWSYTWIWS